MERTDEISCSLLAILSGEHLLFLGPPGTAKSLLSKTMCEAIDGIFFYYLLTRFTTPEEIFGPLSLKALQQDNFQRNIDGYLPTAHIAFLDEIFKSNSSILNSFLTILNERKFHNGHNVVSVPLLSVFGASNELPEDNESLEALYDRFLFRCSVSYIQDETNFKELIFSSPDNFRPSVKLSIKRIGEIQAASKSIEVDEDAEKIIIKAKKEFEVRNIRLSDRRWKKMVKVLKVASASIGRSRVDRSMVLLLQHMAWDKPEQKEYIRDILIDLIISGGESLEKLKKDTEDLYSLVHKSLDYKFPLPIRCYNCNDTFESLKSINTHRKLNPDHYYFDPYRISLSLRYFNYADLIRTLREEYGWDFADAIPERKRSYVLEMADLKDRFGHAWKAAEKDSKGLKKLLHSNVWISRVDSSEVLNRYENKKRLLQDIEASITAIGSMLEGSVPEDDACQGLS